MVMPGEQVLQDLKCLFLNDLFVLIFLMMKRRRKWGSGLELALMHLAALHREEPAHFGTPLTSQ